jgi:hypothetical protein
MSVIRFSSVPCQDRLDLPQLTCLQVSLDLAQVIDVMPETMRTMWATFSSRTSCTP